MCQKNILIQKSSSRERKSDWVVVGRLSAYLPEGHLVSQYAVGENEYVVWESMVIARMIGSPVI